MNWMLSGWSLQGWGLVFLSESSYTFFHASFLTESLFCKIPYSQHAKLETNVDTWTVELACVKGQSVPPCTQQKIITWPTKNTVFSHVMPPVRPQWSSVCVSCRFMFDVVQSSNGDSRWLSGFTNLNIMEQFHLEIKALKSFVRLNWLLISRKGSLYHNA